MRVALQVHRQLRRPTAGRGHFEERLMYGDRSELACEEEFIEQPARPMKGNGRCVRSYAEGDVDAVAEGCTEVGGCVGRGGRGGPRADEDLEDIWRGKY